MNKEARQNAELWPARWLGLPIYRMHSPALHMSTDPLYAGACGRTPASAVARRSAGRSCERGRGRMPRLTACSARRPRRCGAQRCCIVCSGFGHWLLGIVPPFAGLRLKFITSRFISVLCHPNPISTADQAGGAAQLRQVLCRAAQALVQQRGAGVDVRCAASWDELTCGGCG